MCQINSALSAELRPQFRQADYPVFSNIHRAFLTDLLLRRAYLSAVARAETRAMPSRGRIYRQAAIRVSRREIAAKRGACKQNGRFRLSH